MTFSQYLRDIIGKDRLIAVSGKVHLITVPDHVRVFDSFLLVLSSRVVGQRLGGSRPLWIHSFRLMSGEKVLTSDVIKSYRDNYGVNKETNWGIPRPNPRW